MQHSDKKDWTLKPMKNLFDDCDEVELHKVVIWHKKTSYFILRSTLAKRLAGCNANNWPRPKALIGQQAAAALQWRRTGCNKTHPLLVLGVVASWRWVTRDIYEWLVHEWNNHSTYKLARAFKSAKTDGIHLCHSHLCILKAFNNKWATVHIIFQCD